MGWICLILMTITTLAIGRVIRRIEVANPPKLTRTQRINLGRMADEMRRRNAGDME